MVPALQSSGVSEMRRFACSITLMLLATLAVNGCGETTSSRAGSGALMGATGGTAIGSLSGNADRGAAIGAGAGVLSGDLFDQHRRGNIG